MKLSESFTEIGDNAERLEFPKTPHIKHSPTLSDIATPELSDCEERSSAQYSRTSTWWYKGSMSHTPPLSSTLSVNSIDMAPFRHILPKTDGFMPVYEAQPAPVQDPMMGSQGMSWGLCWASLTHP